MATFRPLASGNSQTMLQLCGEYVIAETARAKAPSAKLDMLELALRIISNCCSCIEGRMQLVKVSFTETCIYLYLNIVFLA